MPVDPLDAATLLLPVPDPGPLVGGSDGVTVLLLVPDPPPLPELVEGGPALYPVPDPPPLPELVEGGPALCPVPEAPPPAELAEAETGPLPELDRPPPTLELDGLPPTEPDRSDGLVLPAGGEPCAALSGSVWGAGSKYALRTQDRFASTTF